MARQFIYHMQGLTKAYGAKKVLDGIHLSFYPDAKIGVLGPNGAGKSTLLKIMAGIDKEFTGEGWVAEGATVGYLPQEPQLDPSKDVLGNVMDGVAKKQAILDQYNELMMDYSDENAAKAAGISTPRSNRRWTRCAARRGMHRSRTCRAANAAASRCAGCCWNSPTCCCSMSRRTISTPRPSTGWKTTCATIPARS